MAVSWTRKDLRREVLARFGDLVVATATTDGTTTTLTDTATLFGESSTYAGRTAYFTGGTAANLGQTRRVSGYNGTTQTLTFQTALPAAVAEGDEVELTNAYGIGVTHDGVHRSLNWAIAIARNAALVPAYEEVADTFDGRSARTVALPETWVGIESVDYQHPASAEWKPVKHARKRGQDGWSVDHANRTVIINGDWAGKLDGYDLRLYGYTMQDPLTSDDDTIAIDIEWVTDKATGHLMLDVSRSRAGADWGNQALYYEQQARESLTMLTPNLGPSFTRI